MEEALPRSREQITVEWLESAAGMPPGTVTGLRVEALDGGYAAMVLRLTPDYATPGAGPANFIAKLASSPERATQLLHSSRSYEREVAFYRDLVPLGVGLRVPRAYSADFEPTTGEFVLLLENVTRAAVGDIVEGCSLAQVRAVVKSLARMHARWWRSEILDDDLFTSSDAIASAMAARAVAGAPIAPRIWGETLSVEAARALHTIGPAFAELWMRDRATQPMTLAHGDVHGGNVLFPREGGEPVFIDWQGPRRGRGLHDVARFMLLSVAAETRREAEDELITEYHEELVRGGADVTLEWCVEDYRAQLWLNLGRMLTEMSGPVEFDMSIPRNRRIGAAVGSRVTAIIEDLGEVGAFTRS
jgi:hypothetical protein